MEHLKREAATELREAEAEWERTQLSLAEERAAEQARWQEELQRAHGAEGEALSGGDTRVGVVVR